MKCYSRFFMLCIVGVIYTTSCLWASTNFESSGTKDIEANSNVVKFTWAAGKSSAINQLLYNKTDGTFHSITRIDPTGRYIVSYKPLELRDIKKDKSLGIWENINNVKELVISPSGKYLLVVNTVVSLLEINDDTLTPLRTFGVSTAHAVFSPDERFILTQNLYDDKSLLLWDISTGKQILTIGKATDKDAEPIYPAAFSPDGRYALSRGRSFILWEVSSGKKVRTFPDSSRLGTGAVAFSRDGKYVLSGGTNIILWETSSGRMIRSFEAPDRPTRSVAFYPDGRYALSTGDYSLNLWDTTTGRLMRTFPASRSGTDTIVIPPDGRFVFTCSDSGMFSKWSIVPDYTHALINELLSDYSAPIPIGRLEQKKYENKSSFEARVAITRTDYETAIKKYNNEVSSKLMTGPSPKELTSSFSDFYGDPELTATDYDAESGIYTFTVRSSSAHDDFKYIFSLTQQIPNDKAEAFDNNFKTSKPTIHLALSNRKIIPIGVEIKVKGKKYTALPSTEREQDTPAVANLQDINRAAESPQIDALSLAKSSDSPELLAKAAELARLQKEKLDQAKIAEMESEIAKLKNEGMRAYTSDVDTANFKNRNRDSDFALIVGVETYSHKYLPKADYAERDAESVHQYMSALGIPDRNIKVLTGSAATFANIKSYLESWLPKNANRNSNIFFYFSGHGAPDAKTGTSYILPWDGSPDFLETSAYSLKDTYESLGKLKASHVVAILDSCFSGNGGRSVIQKGARPIIVTQGANTAPPNITILTASNSNEISGGLESQGHGIFTYYLLKGIYSGISDSNTLCTYIKPKVQDEAARQNRTQTPVCTGSKVDFLH